MTLSGDADNISRRSRDHAVRILAYFNGLPDRYFSSHGPPYLNAGSARRIRTCTL